MGNLAIIPARGGSKRIPGKNLRSFNGIPIISYSIAAARNSSLFDEIMVSTDDESIRNYALQKGVNVPFMRSKANSDDYATLSEVVIEVISSYQMLHQRFDAICVLLPTAPLVRVHDIIRSYEMMNIEEFSSVVPVVQFSYPIQRAFGIDDAQSLSMLWPENKFVRSQDLQPTYHDSGQFYWLKTKDFLAEKTIFMESTGGLIIDELHAHDIDTEADWQIAEFKYKFIHRDHAAEDKV